MYLTLKKVVVNDFLQQQNISWDLKRINVLVGKNGSGKTSLLNIIFNMLLEDKRRIDEDNSTSTEEIEKSLAMDLSGKIELHFEEEPLVFGSQKMFSDLNFLDNLVDIISKSQKDIEFSLKKRKEVSVEIKGNYTNTYKYDIDKLERVSKLLSKNSITSSKRTFYFNDYRIKERSKFNFEFISTINLNANAINQYVSSDGSTKSTVLNLEIQKEISKIKNKKNKEIFIQKLISSINSFFLDSKKTVHFQDDDFVVYLENKNKINISALSSGEQQLFFIFLKIINCSDKRTIFLMDEPEISLHLDWQERLITEIIKVNNDCQLIIVTHSPAIIMNGWMDSYTDIENITVSKEDI